MGFATYQCVKYQEYLKAHKRMMLQIYQLIADSPLSKTYMGKHLGYDYFAFHKRMKGRKFTDVELVKILDLIK